MGVRHITFGEALIIARLERIEHPDITHRQNQGSGRFGLEHAA
jgi:hypothetical protein